MEGTTVTETYYSAGFNSSGRFYAAADKLLAYGDAPRNANLDPVEQAAWTIMANLLINLDETITK